MLLFALVFSLSLTASGQTEDDWVDPYDMLNYDAGTNTMRKPTEPVVYPNVPTEKGEYSQDSCQAKQTSCDRQVMDLHAKIEEQKKKIKHISQQPTCTPVFKRFLSRLLKEVQRVGLPGDSADVLYDAKIKLSRQSITELETLLEGEESWRTGALDYAVSQILVDLRPHDYEAWRWRFEDTFGVDIDTLLKIWLCALVIVAIICTQLWSRVSWFIQFSRLFTVCFFVSVIWNWFYLYKIAFADHQKNMVKMDDISEKCTGVKKIDWSDSLKEFFRSTVTLQDDPCKKYYEVLFVNPLLLVPPTKAFSVTIVTFITEPLKHIGEGISDFVRALLKDLPITLQIPVLLTIMFAIVVSMYGGVHAAFQHGIMAPFRRPQRDPPPPQLQRQQRHIEEIEDRRVVEGGDEPQLSFRHRANDGRLPRNQVHQRRPNILREAKVQVETLRTAERPYNYEDERDAEQHEQEQNLSQAGSDPQNQPETHEELVGAGDSGAAAAAKPGKPSESNSPHSETKPLKANENVSKDELCGESGASKSPPAEKQLSHRQQDPKVSTDDSTPSDSPTQVETIGAPTQESRPRPVAAEKTTSAK